jgi:hypothetical protein
MLFLEMYSTTPARWQAQKISASLANLLMASGQIRTLIVTNATEPRL